jgi:hypothetical protein
MRWKAGEEQSIFWHAECFAQGIFNEAMVGTRKAVDLWPVADKRMIVRLCISSLAPMVDLVLQARSNSSNVLEQVLRRITS